MSRKSIMFMVMVIMAAFLFSAAWAGSDKPKEKGKENKIVKEQPAQQVHYNNNRNNSNEVKDKPKVKEEKAIKEKPVQHETPEAKTKAKKNEKWTPSGLNNQERAEWVNGTPPGWQHGNKTGWKGGNLPPGLAKKFYQPQYKPWGWDNWTDQQKASWRRDFENSKLEIWERARRLQIQDLNSQINSLYYATDQGVPIYWTRRTVDYSMDKGLTGFEIEQITRAMAYGAQQNVNFSQLGNFIYQNLNNGVRGDELTLAIYREIERLRIK